MTVIEDILKGRKYTRSDEIIVNGIRIVVDDNYPPKGEDYCDGK